MDQGKPAAAAAPQRRCAGQPLAAGDHRHVPAARRTRGTLLHIFNDEKQLAALTGTALFSDGRLTLEVLSCDAPLGALRIAALRPEGPVLIVENKSTFDSAWRAQRAAENPGYAAIVFGAGDAAAALLPDLRELPSTLAITPTAFEYARDVDIAGIEAAAAFTDVLTSAGLPVTMAHPLWMQSPAQSRPVRTSPPTGNAPAGLQKPPGSSACP
jgi:hypothetical protein